MAALPRLSLLFHYKRDNEPHGGFTKHASITSRSYLKDEMHKRWLRSRNQVGLKG